MDKQVFWDIEKTCCFTGHRNNMLPFCGDREKQGMKRLISSIHLNIEQAVNDGYTTFISGMANGIDLICAEIVHNLISRKNLNIDLICAIPYKNHSAELVDPVDKYIYNIILQDSNVVYVNENKTRDCYKKRNQFMIENSSLLIGVYHKSAKRTGTFQTINMAEKANLQLRLIDLDSNPIYYIS